MKLYNKTKIPDKVLERLLYRSAKAVGSVRTQKTVVKVTTSQYGCSGVVKGTGFGMWKYYERYLKGSGSSTKLIWSDGGYMFLRVPSSNFRQDPLMFSEEVYKLAAHEWRHIRDHQKHVKMDTHKKRWANRSHEKRAMNSAKKAVREIDRREDIQDAILNFAIEVEMLWKDKKKAWDKRLAKAKARQLTKTLQDVRMLLISGA